MIEKKDTAAEIRKKVELLNKYTIAYDAGKPLISDEEWDELYFSVKNWEKENGRIADFNSPTQTICFQEVSKLEKVEHSHAMLSLDKTKDLDEIRDFCGDKDCIAMLKMDGLTCSLKYENGILVRAETRGNGLVGEDITHNAAVVKNIPYEIEYKGTLTVDGEIICKYDDFEPFAAEYKNPRNFAAGSIRLLNSKESYLRNLTFVAWDCIGDNIFDFHPQEQASEIKKCLFDKLCLLAELNFETVPKIKVNYFIAHPTMDFNDRIQTHIEMLQQTAKENGYPIDGLVFKYNDCVYYDSLGSTSHHFLGGLALKFYDEVYETTLRDVEWTMGRTGVLTPIAIFDEVDTGDAKITRASLHNISIMEELGLDKWYDGLRIEVFQANMITPQLKRICPGQAESAPYPFEVEKCPICGGNTIIRQINDSKELVCANSNCSGKLINRLDHFCSREGLDIRGLSKATLEKLIQWEWVENFSDIFNLKNRRSEWVCKPGFGQKSVDNILAAIEKSKYCKLSNFITALGIPQIGHNVAKEIVSYFSTYEELRQMVDNNYDFSSWRGFAESKTNALLNFDYTEADNVALLLNIETDKKSTNKNTLENKIFVITGRLEKFKNRDELKQLIESNGGKVVNSISKKTSYLINNDVSSATQKNKSAHELGIPVISEKEFLKLIDF